MMLTIEHCTVEQFGNGYKVIADDGYVIYRTDRHNAWLDYCQQHEEHPRKYPAKTLFEFMTFSAVVYLPANVDLSKYATMIEADGMRINGKRN